VRSAFEQRATALIPKATLEALPAFRSLAARAVAPPAATGKSRKEKAGSQASLPQMGPAASSSSPGSSPGKPAAQPSSTSGTANTTVTPPVPTPPAPASRPAASAPLTAAEKEKMSAARRLLGEEGKTKDLRQAFQLARKVADAHPESSEAQLLAAEAAYRISRWGDAATYFHRGGDPGESQPELLFYMAVSLYESGDSTGAAAALRRSLPNLQRTPYVDGYARKILGT
jgi:hypothetical protein